MDYTSGTTVSFSMGLVCDGGGMYVCMVGILLLFTILLISSNSVAFTLLAYILHMYNTYYTYILSIPLALYKINTVEPPLRIKDTSL